jgi:hypothetical protein
MQTDPSKEYGCYEDKGDYDLPYTGNLNFFVQDGYGETNDFISERIL